MDDTGVGCLDDGTPVVHLIVLAGKIVQRNSEDLLKTLISQINHKIRDQAHVQLLCPYSDESAIDVVIRSIHNCGRSDHKQHFDLIELYEQNSKPNLLTAHFWSITQEIRKSDSQLRFRVPEPYQYNQDLLSGTKLVEAEMKTMTNEAQYKTKINDAYVPLWEFGDPSNIEEKITENVLIWVRDAIRNCKQYFTSETPASFSLLQRVTSVYLSGSMAEGCRLKTTRQPNGDTYLDIDEIEIDLILAAHLDVE